MRHAQLDSRIEQMESESHDRRRLQRSALQAAEEPALRTWAWETEGAALFTTRQPPFLDLTRPEFEIGRLACYLCMLVCLSFLSR